MESRDPRDYYIILQDALFTKFDEEGFVEEYTKGPNKTFWLEAKDGSFKRRYSTKSAPKWIMQIYKKIIK